MVNCIYIGKGAARYSVDDYIIAAIDIYLTVITLLRTLLRLLGWLIDI